MKYPKLENIKSRDDSDSWQVGFGQGLRPKDAPAAWTAAILSRWLAFVAANPSLRYSRSGGPCFHCGEPRKRYYGYNSRCQCGGPSGWIDHAFHVRIKGTRGEASVLTVSQSYTPNGEGLDSLETALGFLYGGADRSWYYPGTTHLLVFGREEQLELVNLDYSTAGFSPPPSDAG